MIKLILKGYLLWIWYYISANYRRKRKEESNRRMSICKACQYYNPTLGICNICGCIMKVKVKMHFELDENGKSIGGCVEKFW